MKTLGNLSGQSALIFHSSFWGTETKKIKSIELTGIKGATQPYQIAQIQ